MKTKENSRTSNVLKSTVAGMAGYIATYIMSFVFRTIFIHSLGQSYLGIQGLFSNILSMLSLAELGISTAITFSLYRPLAENDTITINSLMRYYKKAYGAIATVVAMVGLGLCPFLSFFVKDPPNISEPLWVIYLLYLLNTVMTYSMVYRQSLIRADQKTHIISIVTNICTICRDIVQIVWLLLFRSFLPVLIIQISFSLIANVILYTIAGRLYPYLCEKNATALDINKKKDIETKVKSLFLYKFSGFIIDGTDNLLIGKMIGIVAVGLYSNYFMLISMIKTISNFFINAVASGVGNYVATKSKEESLDFFYELTFMMFGFFSFCSVCLITLLNPFIDFWIGKAYLFDFTTVLMIVVNFMFYGLRQVQLIYRNVLGLYSYCTWKPVAESVLNIFLSVLFAKFLGIIGVFMGTAVSFMCTTLWVEPYVLFKHYFKQSVRKYALNYLTDIIFTVMTAAVCYLAISALPLSGFALVVVGLVVNIVVFFLLFWLCYQKKREYVSCIKRLKSIVAKLLRKETQS